MLLPESEISSVPVSCNVILIDHSIRSCYGFLRNTTYVRFRRQIAALPDPFPLVVTRARERRMGRKHLGAKRGNAFNGYHSLPDHLDEAVSCMKVICLLIRSLPF